MIKEMEKKMTYKLMLSGRVQGVGFRYFASTMADIHHITGYVKNTIDNHVEIICQGTKEDVDLFISEIKEGPSFSRVNNVEITELKKAKDFDFFEIKYT
jgi:acylphosphatase